MAKKTKNKIESTMPYATELLSGIEDYINLLLHEIKIGDINSEDFIYTLCRENLFLNDMENLLMKQRKILKSIIGDFVEEKIRKIHKLEEPSIIPSKTVKLEDIKIEFWISDVPPDPNNIFKDNPYPKNLIIYRGDNKAY
jgi:hypothetical protein